MEKKLYRDEQRKTIGGVCAGLADYFGTDIAIVRAIFVLALLLKGVGFIPYIVLWIVLPRKDYRFNDRGFGGPIGTPNFDPNYNNPNVDYTVPPMQPGAPFMYTPPKSKSNVGAVFGVILIVLGSIFLLDQIDIIPDFDFEKLWPVILMAVGAVFIFSGKKKPWEKDGWEAEPAKEDPYKVNTDTVVTEAQDTNKKDDQTTNTPIV